MNTTASLDIGEYLKFHETFKHMPERLIQKLSDTGQVLTFQKGSQLFRQEEPADYFYIVISGRISVEIPSIYGPPLTVQTLKDGNVLGWSWLIPPYRWTFEATSETETEVLRFSGAILRKECEADPELGYQLLKCFASLMSERLHEARIKMIETWSAPGFA